MVVKLGFLKRLGDLLVAELLLATQAGLCCMEWLRKPEISLCPCGVL
jgi:hypothetical protein